MGTKNSKQMKGIFFVKGIFWGGWMGSGGGDGDSGKGFMVKPLLIVYICT
jgi:hypothetical protein